LGDSCGRLYALPAKIIFDQRGSGTAICVTHCGLVNGAEHLIVRLLSFSFATFALVFYESLEAIQPVGGGEMSILGGKARTSHRRQ
jgi:hypothetical protein